MSVRELMSFQEEIIIISKQKPPSGITICTHVSVLQIYLLWRGGGIRIGEDIKSSNSKVLLKKLLFV